MNKVLKTLPYKVADYIDVEKPMISIVCMYKINTVVHVPWPRIQPL